MMGYDMGWASFHVIEVMSSPRIHLKSMGYLAAAQSFSQDTDVLMLVTNTLKKVRESNIQRTPTFTLWTIGPCFDAR
jgi:AP-3 complex subunit delta-1